MNTFILVVGDSSDLDDVFVAADTVAKSRIEKGLWPIYRHTRNRSRIAAGDEVFIYLAGRSYGSQTFIASAIVEDVLSADNVDCRDSDELLSDYPYRCIKLNRVNEHNYVSIRPILSKLSFVKHEDRWGMYFQGGARMISSTDRELIYKEMIK